MQMVHQSLNHPTNEHNYITKGQFLESPEDFSGPKSHS